MDRQQNYLKAARFETPEYIPMTFHINDACWNHYPQDWLKEQMEAHPFLFPGYKYTKKRIKPRYDRAARVRKPFRDHWDCLWETTEDGITGTVTEHPLQDWDDFDDYSIPHPGRTNGMELLNWPLMRLYYTRLRKKGSLFMAGLPHGHTFLRLCDIRGYENILFDMVDDNPKFRRLLNHIEEFNTHIIKQFVSLGTRVISFPEDLGMEQGPMISPDLFRRFIKPVYKKMMDPVRDAGALVHMHSDGDIKTLADDLVDDAVDILNLQDLPNGIEWIRETLHGRICIELDIDRTRITPFAAPKDVDSLVLKEVETLGSAAGGLMMIYGLYPGVPLKNVEALMDAMERYATHFS